MGNSLYCCHTSRDKDSDITSNNSKPEYTEPYPSFHNSHATPCGCALQPVQHPSVAASPNDKLVAVVVTIRDGASYDAMFTKIPQEGEPGTRVAVYQTSSQLLPAILGALREESQEARGVTSEQQDAARQLLAEINLCDNDCVVFNWECCGGCGDNGFPGDPAVVLGVMKCLLERGSMVMCSDFSLKALISDWDANSLGPNPFVKVGTFGDQFKLHFEPAVLKECPSSQLQNVGSLCEEKGYACVSAMANTIAYTVDPAQTMHDCYKLQVLSVATETAGLNLELAVPAAMRCKMKAVYGAAGHVLLTYPSGGNLLVSAGHWLELMQLDVSVESLRATAMKEWGTSKTIEMMDVLEDQSLTADEHRTMLQGYSRRLVTSSAPCQKRVSTKLALGY